MKLEKRSEGAPEPQAPAPETPGGKKPVIVYIMILFIVAFVLMAISFFMHQRSNSEVIGRLQDSVSTLQEVQDEQDKNLKLQESLDDAQKQADSLQSQLDDASSAKDSAQQQSDALLALYVLQQQYAAQDYDACKDTIQKMESAGQDKLLPTDAGSGITSPAQRYQQLKQAVEAK